MRGTLYVMASAFALLLAGCGKPSPERTIESVESLVGNPQRLRELRAACKADHAKVGDAQCNAVAEATRRRFLGSGGPKYTPPASEPGGFWQDDDHKAQPTPKDSP